MSDQEIIDAINSEIEAMTAAGAILCRDAYVNGLRFARDLIAKRTEASLNTAQGAYLDAGGAL